jgi:phenylpropionate dioxygenase-like ring-hydroxylating dioxygenase large terminal subunit
MSAEPGMFVRNAWYVAAWSSEVAERPIPRTLLGDPIVLFRRRQGGVAALLDRCCHRGLPLSLGEVRDELIVCGYHGLAYDGAGRCVEIPGQGFVSPRMRVTAYPVVEQDELIWIWMGQPARADRKKIPAYSYHADRQEWPHESRTQRVRCGYRLVIDNLLDLTLFTALAATFDEDAVILEAQHSSLKARPEPLLSTAHDRARVIAERKMDEWLAAEAAVLAQAGA